MLWIYYAFLNTSVSLLITINSFGCVIETIYIAMYLIYAPKKAKVSIIYIIPTILPCHFWSVTDLQFGHFFQIFTVKILFLFNVVIFGLILLLTLFLSEGGNRVRILGWVCVAFSVSVFVAPLSVIVSMLMQMLINYIKLWREK